jgi:hypothetical protein
MEVEKIGLVMWLEVHKHSRVTYLKLRAEDVHMYDIRPGDVMKVEIQAIRKGPRDQESE